MHKQSVLRVFRRLVELGVDVDWIADKLSVDVDVITSVLSGGDVSVNLFNRVSDVFDLNHSEVCGAIELGNHTSDILELPLLLSPYIGPNPRRSSSYTRDYPISGEPLNHITEDEVKSAYLLRIPKTCISPYSLHVGDIVLIVQRSVSKSICGIVLVDDHGRARLARLLSDGRLECTECRKVIEGASEVGVCVGVVWRRLAYEPKE